MPALSERWRGRWFPQKTKPLSLSPCCVSGQPQCYFCKSVGLLGLGRLLGRLLSLSSISSAPPCLTLPVSGDRGNLLLPGPSKSSICRGEPGCLPFPQPDHCSGMLVIGFPLGRRRHEGSCWCPCPWKVQGQRTWGLVSTPSSKHLLKSVAACPGPAGWPAITVAPW